MPSSEWQVKNKDHLREYHRRWATQNRDHIREYSREGRKRKRLEFYRAIKGDLRCIICGESREPCLDFHHLDPTTKKSNVRKLLSRECFRLAEAELSKCVVMCANCHRIWHSALREKQLDKIQQAV